MFDDPVTVPDPDLEISSRPLDKEGGGGARGPSSGFSTV